MSLHNTKGLTADWLFQLADSTLLGHAMQVAIDWLNLQLIVNPLSGVDNVLHYASRPVL